MSDTRTQLPGHGIDHICGFSFVWLNFCSRFRQHRCTDVLGVGLCIVGAAAANSDKSLSKILVYFHTSSLLFNVNNMVRVSSRNISFQHSVDCATVAIAVTIATSMPARVFSRALFGLYSLAMLASVLFGDVRNDTGAWLGIYGSKNALAGAAATYVIICVAQTLDSFASYRYRLLAVFGAMVGLMLLLLAQSVSALIIVPPSLAILLCLQVLYRLSLLQRVVTIIFSVLIIAFLIILAMMYSNVLLSVLLETTGKDVTLTGRTDLWRIALELIAERPLFGMGYQAFWVKGHSPAEVLWYTFGIDTTGIWALRSHRAEAALLFLLVMMVVMVSFVEVPIFFQFSLRTVTIVCAFVFGLRGLATDYRAV